MNKESRTIHNIIWDPRDNITYISTSHPKDNGRGSWGRTRTWNGSCNPHCRSSTTDAICTHRRACRTSPPRRRWRPILPAGTGTRNGDRESGWGDPRAAALRPGRSAHRLDSHQPRNWLPYGGRQSWVPFAYHSWWHDHIYQLYAWFFVDIVPWLVWCWICYLVLYLAGRSEHLNMMLIAAFWGHLVQCQVSSWTSKWRPDLLYLCAQNMWSADLS